eukprot:3499505-Rhodomonas_salina.1
MVAATHETLQKQGHGFRVVSHFEVLRGRLPYVLRPVRVEGGRTGYLTGSDPLVHECVQVPG